jgi:flagellar hook assembly protein FlgD
MKGTLVITDKKGKKIRSITFPATSDGSYRNVKWNGKDSKGKYVKPGTYTWTIKATDDPTRTGLKKGQAAKAIDGKKAASGTVKFKK